ncbi:MAG: hypothetical protein ABIP30_13940 [Ferruginibacter sp.]
MNTQSTTVFAQLSKEHLQDLTKEVKETLATSTAQVKTFSAADMWNIQRQRKSFSRTRRYA